MADQRIRLVAEWFDKGLKRGAGEAEKAVEKVDRASASLSSQFTTVSLAAGAVAITLKQVYEIAKQGAQIEYAAVKFDRLAASIGTTGTALRKDLASATGGLISDAEAMMLAGDMMSLGLANTHDQAVRLATVVSGLGMDMNQLTLTLANQTTMRFDQLGVAVTGFDERLQVLKDSGMDVNEAFTEAFLQQAEAQIERVGSVAETTAGQIMIFEATIRNFKDGLKVATAEGVGPFIEKWNRVMALLQDGTIDRATANIEFFKAGVLGLDWGLENLEQTVRNNNASMQSSIDTWEEIATYYNIPAFPVTQAQEDLAAAIEGANLGLEGQMQKWRQSVEWLQNGGEMYQKVQEQIEANVNEYESLDAAINASRVNQMMMMQAMGDLNGMTIAQIQGQMEGLGFDTQTAYRYAAGLYAQLLAIDGTSVSADIFLTTHGSVPKYRRITDPANQLTAGGQGVDLPIPQAKGGPLADVAIVGEQGAEMIINGVVVPNRLTKQLIALGLIPGKGFATGGPLLDGTQYAPVGAGSLGSAVKQGRYSGYAARDAQAASMGIFGLERDELAMSKFYGIDWSSFYLPGSGIVNPLYTGGGDSLSPGGGGSTATQTLMAQQTVSFERSIAMMSAQLGDRFERSNDEGNDLLAQILAKTVSLDDMRRAFRDAQRSA